MERALQALARWSSLTAVWWIVSEGAISALPIGVVAALAATGVSFAVHPARLPRVRLGGLLRFIGFFLVHSVRGGVDVASRVLRPSLPVDPVWIDYRLRLTDPLMRALFMATLSLLPGTLSVHLSDGRLVIHTLGCDGSIFEDASRVERRVGGVFGVSVPVIEGSSC